MSAADWYINGDAAARAAKKFDHRYKDDGEPEGPPAFRLVMDDALVAEGGMDDLLKVAGPGDAAGPRVETKTFHIRTLDCLLKAEFPPPRWLINGIMSEGLNLLIGSPKMGKSLLALNIALTIAGGGKALQDVPVEAADVLYLSLEDKDRRVQDRATRMMRALPESVAGPARKRLSVVTSWPRQDAGGLRLIDAWAGKVKAPGLVIIDVWNKFAPTKSGNSNAYMHDAQAVGGVKDYCDRRGLAGLIVHHDRKALAGMKAEDDFVASISGTQGIAGGADGIMVLVRNRTETTAELKITGRDVEERILALDFVPDDLTWKCLGGAERLKEGEVQTAVLAYLEECGEAGASLKDISDSTGQKYNSVVKAVSRMREEDLVRHKGKKYYLVGISPF